LLKLLTIRIAMLFCLAGTPKLSFGMAV